MMVGYIGVPADAGRRIVQRAVPSATRLTHVEEGCVVMLESPPAAAGVHTLRSDIAVGGQHVMAFEGYLLDVDRPNALSPAQWLLREYLARGLAAFERLNGAYAMCLFDRLQRQAWLAACPFARRELYYAAESSAVAFATDLAPLLSIMTRAPELDTDRIAASFMCGALHGTDTLLKGIRRTLPGAVVHVAAGRAVERPPVPLTPTTCDPLDARDAEDELDSRLRCAVARLAPVTERQVVLMSAGVDSSLVAGYVKAVTGRLEALTLTTPPDETARARAICDALGGVHHVVSNALDEIDVVADLERFVGAMDEPVLLGLGLPMMVLARRGRALADGFVCGLGGDTLFGQREPELGDDRRDSIFHYFRTDLDPALLSEVVDLTGPHPDSIVPALRTQLSGDIDLRFWMMFELRLAVRMASRVARAHGAEAVSPFLDRDVVDAALSLPPHLLTLDKPLLRALAIRHFSADLQQPWKVGFAAAPIERLHTNGRLGALLDVLAEPRTRWRGVYRDRGLQRLVDLYRTGRAEAQWHPVLWQVAVFELFCRRFVDRAAEPVAVASQ